MQTDLRYSDGWSGSGNGGNLSGKNGKADRVLWRRHGAD